MNQETNNSKEQEEAKAVQAAPVDRMVHSPKPPRERRPARTEDILPKARKV